MKRLISFLLALCLLGSITVSADSDLSAEAQGYYGELLPISDISFTTALPETVTTDGISRAALDAVYTAICNHSASVNIYSYGVPSSAAQNFYYMLWYNYPLVDSLADSVTTYGMSGKIATIKITYHSYTSTKDNADAVLNYCNAELDRIAAKVPTDATDLEKVLYIHDYLASNYCYDTSLTIRDVYRFLSTGTGVCQSYAMVFYALMERLNIEVHSAYSMEISHIWNIVKLGNQYYHVDVTFDDPTPDRFGRVWHNYFLVSSAKLLALAADNGEDRSDWTTFSETVPTCNATTYDSGFVWQNTVCPMVRVDKNWYMINTTTKYFCRCGADFKSATALAKQPASVWYANAQKTSSWSGYFGGLFAVGKVLYTNTQSNLAYYDTVGGTVGILALPAQADGNLSIFGSNLSTDGTKLQLGYYDGANSSDRTTVTLDLPLLTNSDASWAVTIADTYSVLLGIKSTLHSALLDANGDGLLDIRDLVNIKKRAAA